MHDLAIKRNVYQAGESQHEHAHRETQITMFVSGFVQETVGHSHRLIRPLEFVIKPAGLKHRNEFGEFGARTIQISLAHRPPSIPALVGTLQCYRSGFSPLITQLILRMSSAQNLNQAQIKKHLECILESIQLTASPARLNGCIQQPNWLNAVARQIEHGYCGKVSVAKIAKQVNRHPVSIARVFRAQFGQSIKQRVRQRRVQRAADLLCENKQSSIQIAQTCGFADQSHFNRVFKSVTGITPVQFQRFALKKTPS